MSTHDGIQDDGTLSDASIASDLVNRHAGSMTVGERAIVHALLALRDEIALIGPEVGAAVEQVAKAMPGERQRRRDRAWRQESDKR